MNRMHDKAFGRIPSRPMLVFVTAGVVARRRLVKNFCLAALSGLLLFLRYGQAAADTVTLDNGMVFEGTVIGETPGEIIFRSAFGEMRLLRSRVKQLEYPPDMPADGQRGRPSPDADPEVRKQVDAAMRVLRNAGRDTKRLEAMDDLVQIGAAGVPDLSRYLRRADVLESQWIALALEKIADPGSVDALIANLQRHGPRVPVAVVSALGVLRDARAVAPLMDLYGQCDTAPVKQKILNALSLLRDPESVSIFVQALQDPHDGVRGTAARLLPDFVKTTGTAATALRAILTVLRTSRLGDEREAMYRVDLIRMTGVLGDEGVMADVLAELGNPSAEIRMASIQCLRRYQNPMVLDRILDCLEHDVSWKVRAQAALAVGDMAAAKALNPQQTEQALDALIAALNAPEKRVKQYAAGSLQKLTAQNLGQSRQAWSAWRRTAFRRQDRKGSKHAGPNQTQPLRGNGGATRASLKVREAVAVQDGDRTMVVAGGMILLVILSIAFQFAHRRSHGALECANMGCGGEVFLAGLCKHCYEIHTTKIRKSPLKKTSSKFIKLKRAHAGREESGGGPSHGTVD